MSLPIFPAALTCPLLSTNNSSHGASFIRSDFEYATRQRKVRCAKPIFSASFNFDQSQYDIFRSFFENDLVEGSREFEADWTVHGIVSAGKVVRFTTPYSETELGNGYYNVSGQFELLEKGV